MRSKATTPVCRAATRSLTLQRSAQQLDGTLLLDRPDRQRRHLLERRLGRLRPGPPAPAGHRGRRKAPGVVVLGGDVHSNYVPDLKVDYDDAHSPVVATEFCSTSISSMSLPQDRLDSAREFNPHIHYARSDQRSYVRFALDAKQMPVQLRVVDNALDPSSGIATAASFTVDPNRPGAVAA